MVPLSELLSCTVGVQHRCILSETTGDTVDGSEIRRENQEFGLDQDFK